MRPARGPPGGRRPLVVGERRTTPAGLTTADTLSGVGDEQKISWQELFAKSREDFESGTDFTVAVEEEFALLDPETLELTDRFEEIYAAAQETDGGGLDLGVQGFVIVPEVLSELVVRLAAMTTEERGAMPANVWTRASWIVSTCAECEA